MLCCTMVGAHLRRIRYLTYTALQHEPLAFGHRHQSPQPKGVESIMGSFLRARPGRKSAATAVSCLAAIALVLQSSATIAQPSGDLVIHNGLIINATGRMAADIRISGEKI